MTIAIGVVALFKKQSTTILLYFLDEYSNLKNIIAANAVEDGPWKGFTRKLALTELTALWEDKV